MGRTMLSSTTKSGDRTEYLTPFGMRDILCGQGAPGGCLHKDPPEWGVELTLRIIGRVGRHPWRKHTGKGMAILSVLLLAVVLTGCRAPGGKPYETTAPISGNGPIHNLISGPAGESATVPPGLVVYKTGQIILANTGKKPVVLVAVQFGRKPGTTHPMPHLLDAYVLTSQKQYDDVLNRIPPPSRVQNYALLPGSANLAYPPRLVLKLSANGPRSYNDFILLAYEGLNGQKYAVTYPYTYLLCNGPKAKACEANVP